MANWARAVLVGGPFDGEEAAFVRPDLSAPVQVVWSGWMPWGFDAWLYEWHGEKTMDRGRTDKLIYRPSGRRLRPDEIPYAVAEAADTWSYAPDLLSEAYGVLPELLWPGI